MSRPLFAAALGLAVAACTSSRQVSPAPDYVPRRVVELARFEVRQGGEVLGTLLQLQIEDRAGPIPFWRVENRSGAWLGHASEQLRFSRRVPFRDDEQDLGIWPMPQGVARLFDVDGEVVLRQLPAAAPASARRGR